MIELVLASRNRKKIAEMTALLAETVKDGIKILSLDDIGYDGWVTGEMIPSSSNFW